MQGEQFWGRWNGHGSAGRAYAKFNEHFQGLVVYDPRSGRRLSAEKGYATLEDLASAEPFDPDPVTLPVPEAAP